jgi:hypothetical protein
LLYAFSLSVPASFDRALPRKNEEITALPGEVQNQVIHICIFLSTAAPPSGFSGNKIKPPPIAWTGGGLSGEALALCPAV